MLKHQLFRIDGGDGEQAFFGILMFARLAEEPWFRGSIDDGREAWLLKIESEPRIGEFVAITSRWTSPLAEQLATSGWLAVVVHRIVNPGAEYESTLQFGIGMAAIQAVEG
jgi:hypothetical protein